MRIKARLCLLMIFLAAALYLINISPEAEPPVIGPPTPTETATPANFHGIGETAGPLTTDPEDKATPASEASPSADPITESTPDPSLPADLPSVTPSETISPTPTATPVPTPDPNAAPSHTPTSTPSTSPKPPPSPTTSPVPTSNPPEQTVRASSYGVSGSITETLCAFIAGSDKITVDSTESFLVGQGVAIEGAGRSGVKDGWLVTAILSIDGNVLTVRNTPQTNGYAKRLIHDDSAAMQEAVNAAGSKLIIDVKHCYIHNVRLKSDLTVTGDRPILYAPPYTTNPNRRYNVDYQIFYIEEKHNIVIDNLVFDQGSTRGVEGDLYNGVISFRSINNENITFKNNLFQNGKYLAGRNYGSQKNIRFYRNTFNNVDTAMHFYGDIQADGITIEENVVSDGTSECVAIISGQSPDSWAKNIKIINNRFSGKVNSAAIFYGGNTTHCEIAFNTIENCLGGIICYDTHIETQPITSQHISIHGNTITTGSWIGIQAAGRDIEITKNTITGYHVDGISFDTSTISENVTIRENTIVACGAPMRLQHLKKAVVTKNIIKSYTTLKGFPDGIVLRSNLSETTIEDNQFILLQ
jgi:outer membrane biosynthesis protein TonB